MCSICLEILALPVTFHCTHSVCSNCWSTLKESLQLPNVKCPECRNTIKEPNEVKVNQGSIWCILFLNVMWQFCVISVLTDMWGPVTFRGILDEFTKIGWYTFSSTFQVIADFWTNHSLEISILLVCSDYGTTLKVPKQKTQINSFCKQFSFQCGGH